MTLAQKLAALRKNAGLNMSELAEKVGVSRSLISKYEKGERMPGREVLILLSDFYGVSVDALLGTGVSQSVGFAKNGNIDSKKGDSFDYAKYGFLPIETKKIPFLGEVACGEPIFTEQGVESYIATGTEIQADFALRAKGDSMIGARIMDGDIVFVRSQPTVENGEIAVVLIGDEATLKRVFYYPAQQKLVLNAENPRFEPFVFIGAELETVKILGKAIAFQSDVV